MPDLGTHVLVGYWLRRFVLFKNKVYLPVFLLGCILPDIVFKTGEALLPHDYYWFFNTFHTPVSLLLQCLGLSLLFSRKLRLAVFGNLVAGASLHLLLDAMQSHLSGGNYFWLFPFSNWTGELGWFPVAFWPYLLVGCIILVAASYGIERLRRYKART